MFLCDGRYRMKVVRLVTRADRVLPRTKAAQEAARVQQAWRRLLNGWGKMLMNKLAIALGALLISCGTAFAVKGPGQSEEEKKAKAAEAIKMFNEGAVAVKENNLDGAIVAFTKVIEFRFTDEKLRAQAYMNRGYSYQRKNDCVKAIADYNEAEKVLTENADLFATRAVCYIDSVKDPVKGLADIDKAITLDPAKIDYVRIRCVLHFNQKNFAAAMPDCEKVSAALPKDTSILQAVGQGNEVLKNNDKAIAAYKQLLAADPSNTAAQEGLKRLGAK